MASYHERSLAAYKQGIGAGYKISGKTYMSSASAMAALGLPQEDPVRAAQQQAAASQRQAEIRRQQQQYNIQSLITQYQQAEEKSRAATLKNYEQMMKLADVGIQRWQPGGQFEKSGLELIERGKTKGVGAETQKLIGAGLYGTTVGAGVERRWEEDVGAKARATLEDIMLGRLTQAEQFKTGIMERTEYEPPDYRMLMQAMQSAYSM